MIPEIEKRSFHVKEMRVKKSPDGTQRTITGCASVFEQLSEDLGGFREKVAKTCFNRTIKEADVRALVNHNSEKILGRNTAGTLRLKTDAEGLQFECDAPNTTYANDIIESIDRGDVNQCSFQFSVPEGGDVWEKMADGSIIRTLIDANLLDVSPVTFPAYPQTSCSVRDHLAALKEKPGAQGAAPQEGRAGSLEIIKRQIDLVEIN